jgi:hypothetical protein
VGVLLLGGFATGVYGIVALGGDAVATRMSGPADGRAPLLPVIAATVLIAVTFGPARRTSGRLAARLVCGRRATPYEALRRFTADLPAYADRDEPARWAGLIKAATGAAEVRVWLAVDDAAQPPAADLVVPVRHQGELLGVFLVTGVRPTPVEVGLLEDLAAHAGLALRNARLAAALEARLDVLARQADQLHAARARLATAADDERRRLEHELRLTLTPRLAELGAGVDRLLRAGPADVPAELERLRARAGVAIETVRELAAGAHPPILRDHGIAAALRARTVSFPVPVTVTADRLGRHGSQDEAAVYFCCLDIIRAIAGRAGTGPVRVELGALDAGIRFAIHAAEAVTETGAGSGPAEQLRGIEDRIAARGGWLRLAGGVVGWIPAAPR